ncbi:MAG TPA: hypothetical protein DEB34_04015 [Lactobacillus sp.]|jgi:hypothetical protein|nr:hypothetical protein [Lactobacillus sp.]
MKKYLIRIIKDKMDLIIVSVLTAFLSSIIVFICLDISNGNFDNLADWFGALGSIGAIFAVIYQVHKQREEFLESNRKDGEVCFNIIDELDVYSQEHKYTLEYWIINTGKVVDGYRFIGFVAEKDINSLINGNKESKEIAVQFSKNEPRFNVNSNLESLIPAGQSKETEIDIAILYQYFKKKLDEDIVYIVYKGLSGKFYFKKFIFTPEIINELKQRK